MIGQTISHYKILEKLGEGGMGVVYKAQDLQLDRPVAMKFLSSHLSASEESKSRFMQEAKAAAALNHPNILGVHEIGKDKESIFFVMEYVEGKTLKSHIDNLKSGPGIPFNQALEKSVVELAAQKIGWARKLPQGHGLGIACALSFGTCVAEAAEVSVESGGQVRVHRMVAAVDCGMVVNPDTIEAQVEGAIVYGLSAALHDAITIDGGKVVQGNFDAYRMPRINDMPRVEVHIVKSDAAPGGIGEPGLPPATPAVCNALFAATGKRIRRLPIQPDELKG